MYMILLIDLDLASTAPHENDPVHAAGAAASIRVPVAGFGRNEMDRRVHWGV